MTTRRTVRLLLAVLLVAAGLTSQRLVSRVPERQIPSEYADVAVPDGYMLVTAAIDGDTIELADGSRVRYIGVDTPETVHPTKKVQCYGPESSAFNRILVEGRVVRLEKDVSDTDQYGRLLRYVFLEDGTFVNLELVRQGYAAVVTYPPDVAYTATYQAAEADAKAAGLGRWSACS